MKWLVDFFRKNIHWKIISLLFALVLWAVVTIGQPDVEVPRKVSVHLLTPPDLVRISDVPSYLDITVAGPRNIIRNIKEDALTYPIDVSKTQPGETTVRFIESRIKGLPAGLTVTSMSPTQINIKLAERINRQVPINIVVKGKPAPGFEVVEKLARPDLVEVTGALEEVGRLKFVSTEQVDITGLNTTLKTTVGIDLGGQHVELVQNKEVDILIEIEERKLTRRFENIPIQVVGTDLKAMVKPGTLDVPFQGPENMMKSLSTKDIKLIVDAEGLEPGVHQLKPRIQLPDSDFLVQYDLPPVSVTLKQGKKITISGSKGSDQ